MSLELRIAASSPALVSSPNESLHLDISRLDVASVLSASTPVLSLLPCASGRLAYVSQGCRFHACSRFLVRCCGSLSCHTLHPACIPQCLSHRASWPATYLKPWRPANSTKPAEHSNQPNYSTQHSPGDKFPPALPTSFDPSRLCAHSSTAVASLDSAPTFVCSTSTSPSPHHASPRAYMTTLTAVDVFRIL